MFQHIGYYAGPTTADYAGALATFFPLIKDNIPELRQWTIRFSRVSNGVGPHMLRGETEEANKDNARSVAGLPPIEAVTEREDNAHTPTAPG